jgi:hypothetical protein
MSEPLLKYRKPVAAQDILTEAVPAGLYTEGSGLNLARAALFGVGLDKVSDIVELLRLYRGGRPNSLIMGGPMGWSWYSTLDTTHHGALAGPANAHRHGDLANIGIDDHHARDHATRHHSGGADALALGSIAGNLTDAQHGSRTVANAHAHGHLSGIGVNDHHARDHVLATNTGLGATHTISGAAAGQVLRASAATAANFQQLAHGDLGSVTADQHHARQHALDSGSDHTGSITDAQHGSRTQANAHAHSHLSGIGASDHHTKTTDNEVYGLVQAGTAAGRPAAGVAGRWYFSTDTLVLERDNGAAWVEMARGETAIRLAQLSEKAHSSLTGITADQHHARDHALGGATHTADTLANLNSKISDANLDDQGAARPPQSHALGGAAHSADTFANLTAKVSDATLQKRGDVITDAEHGVRTQANAHAHSHLSGIGVNDHHAQSHNAASHSDIASSGADIDDAVSKRHARQHAINTAADHTSAATPDRVLKADANGLPVNASNTDADVADAVTKKHSQNTDTDLSPAHKDATTGVHGVGASTVESASGAQSKVDAHAGGQAAGIHGSTSAATANKLMHRDASGRAKVAAPSASDDIARKNEVDTHANLTTAHSAVSTATASRLVVRDASARAKFAAPGAAGDALIKGTRLAANEMLAGTSGLPLKGAGAGVNPAYGRLTKAGMEWTANKLLKGAGVGADPTEIDAPSAGEGHITLLPYNYDSIGAGTWELRPGGTSQAMLYFSNASHADLANFTLKAYLSAGTYTMRVLGIKSSPNGIVDIDIDASEVMTFDQYDASTLYNEVWTQTGITISTAGLKSIKVRVDGKNPSSGNHYVDITSITLWRTA